MEAPVKIKRTAITLAQKVQIILKLNNPSFKQKEVAQEYGLTASAISKIAKKKEGILEEWLRGGNLERKRKREGKNQTVDDALLSWFWLASKEGPISGPVLMAKAKALADEMGVEFKPTNGWLCRWKNRNNLAYRRAPRERGEGRTAGHHRTGGAQFPSTPGLPRGQWRAAGAGSSNSSSDETPAGQPAADTQCRPKRVKKEGLPPQSGPGCPSYTAPLDLRSQQEAPGTSHGNAAAGGRNRAERVKAERDYAYQPYKGTTSRSVKCMAKSGCISSGTQPRWVGINSPCLRLKQRLVIQFPWKLPDLLTSSGILGISRNIIIAGDSGGEMHLERATQNGGGTRQVRQHLWRG
ncbi:tigger transposable element-derived protein 5-like isoform X1 [Mobula hypostoma]|uniref:tigger transposable element-derived protein 5-like isoform X1 n=1 Tax=Mobula hypostoma TaxID=723540 RepID=UPI002FC33578